MDHRDQELLDKQMRAIYPPPRHDGLVVVALLAVFLGGLLAGSLMSANPATRTAANGPASSSPGVVLPIPRP